MSTEGRLTAKTAVITGGTGGIGLETARHFVAEGARVVVTGTDAEKARRAAEALGPDAHAVVADVRSADDLERLAGVVRDRFGHLDILFANAGIGAFSPVEATDEAGYDRQFDINVKGVFFTVKALAPLLREGGSIILTASAVNEKGKAGGSVYFATKAAVRSFARSFADEFGPKGIRVNALSPGLIPTDFQARAGMDGEAEAGFAAWVEGVAPLHRVGRADEIAKAAVFLGSDEASYVTAGDLVVDGGFMNI